MPKGDNVEHRLFDVVLDDESFGCLLYLMLSFFASSDLEGEVANLEIPNAREHYLIAQAHLIEEKGFADAPLVCPFGL